MLKNIKLLIENKSNKKRFENIIEELENIVILPKVLQDKLDTIKNTPILEPEINTKQLQIKEDLKTGEIDPLEKYLELLEAIYSAEEIEELFKTITLPELSLFGEEVVAKVFDFKFRDENEKEVFKEPDSHKNMKVLNYLDRKNIRKAAQKIDTLVFEAGASYGMAQMLVSENQSENSEKIKEQSASLKEGLPKIEKLQNELHEKTIKVSGLDATDMSQWEQNLLYAKVVAMAKGEYTPVEGKN